MHLNTPILSLTCMEHNNIKYTSICEQQTKYFWHYSYFTCRSTNPPNPTHTEFLYTIYYEKSLFRYDMKS